MDNATAMQQPKPTVKTTRKVGYFQNQPKKDYLTYLLSRVEISEQPNS